jgi:hypothetical protein
LSENEKNMARECWIVKTIRNHYANRSPDTVERFSSRKNIQHIGVFIVAAVHSNMVITRYCRPRDHKMMRKDFEDWAALIEIEVVWNDDSHTIMFVKTKSRITLWYNRDFRSSSSTRSVSE